MIGLLVIEFLRVALREAKKPLKMILVVDINNPVKRVYPKYK
tara:strand:+ start:963 stop:1088 length:126 start_codon:yes stop_codon:yes gene_type:complete